MNVEFVSTVEASGRLDAEDANCQRVYAIVYWTS